MGRPYDESEWMQRFAQRFVERPTSEAMPPRVTSLPLGDQALLLAKTTLAQDPDTLALRSSVLRRPVSLGLYLGYLKGKTGDEASSYDPKFDYLRSRVLQTNQGRAAYVFGLHAGALNEAAAKDPEFQTLYEGVCQGPNAWRNYSELCSDAFGIPIRRPFDLTM